MQIAYWNFELVPDVDSCVTTIIVDPLNRSFQLVVLDNATDPGHMV